MYFDFSEVRRFYQSPFGQSALSRILPVITNQIDARNQHHVLGFGYCRPYLEGLILDQPVASVASFSPARMGTAPWVGPRGNQSALVSGKHLPLKTASYDRVLLVHALEFSHNPRQLLREVNRILKDDGYAVIVAPMRSGFWARSEATPFGYGEPLSRNQMTNLLEAQMFEVVTIKGALYGLPTDQGVWGGVTQAMEKVMPKIMPHQSGVLIMKVKKNLFQNDRAQKSPVIRKREAVAIPGMKTIA